MALTQEEQALVDRIIQEVGVTQQRLDVLLRLIQSIKDDQERANQQAFQR